MPSMPTHCPATVLKCTPGHPLESPMHTVGDFGETLSFDAYSTLQTDHFFYDNLSDIGMKIIPN